jgi:hypothetical protein
MSIKALTSPATRVAAGALLAGLLVVGGATAPSSTPEAGGTMRTAAPTEVDAGGDHVARLAQVPDSPQKRLTLGVLDNGCPYSRRGIPQCGVLLGAAYGSNTDPTAWEGSMGHRLGVHRTYWGPDEVLLAVQTARQDVAHQRVPWISFKLPYSWSEMAAGQGDNWALHLSRLLATVPGPVWVAFHHEPEGDTTDGDITQWTAMQERLAPIVRSTAPNVAYTIILTGWNQFYGPKKYSLDSLWPRDTKVDLVGFDVYNRYGAETYGRTVNERTRFKAHYFGRFEKFAQEHQMAWGLAETGNTDRSAAVEPQFVQHLYNGVRKHGGVAVTYFNSTLNSTAPWRLVGSKEQRFAALLRSTPTL